MNPKTALITGASYGLGYELALEASRKGYHIIAVGRTQGALDDLADQIDSISGSITLVPMDITDDGAINYLADAIQQKWSQIDIWFHTAWFTAPMQPSAHLNIKDLDKSYQTNIRSTARLISLLDPLMKSGQAVFFDDPSIENSFTSNIGSAKAAQVKIARAWLQESKQIGPKVHILSPRPFFSQMRATLFPGMTKEKLATASEVATEIFAQIEVNA